MRGPAPPSQTRVVLQILLTIATVAAGLWALHRLERVVLLLILATFFAYVIAPLVRLAERPLSVGGRTCRVPRAAAIVLVYLLLAAGAAAGAAILLPTVTQQIDDAVARAPKYTESFRLWERGWSRYYERLRIPVELRQGIDQSVVGAGETTIEYMRGLLMGLLGAVSYLPWLALIPIFAFLLLKDASSLRRALVKRLPDRRQMRTHRLIEDLNLTLAAYIRGQLLASVLVGTMCSVGFAVLGVPYAVLLGILAGILEFIPLAGPLAVAVVVAVIAALHVPMLALWTLGFLAVLRVVEDYVIYPRLIGRDLPLHPLVVVLAVLAGAELGGMAGMFIAVPVVAVITVVGRHWLEWRGEGAAA